MTDRPILFSAPMVRALLNGSKTQTRRVLKPQPSDDLDNLGDGETVLDMATGKPVNLRFEVGDRLWVRETWYCDHIDCQRGPYLCPENMTLTQLVEDGWLHFRATDEPNIWEAGQPKWRTPLHLPRWASRLTLTVTDVRVERLQDCSEADAIAEGINPPTHKVENGNNVDLYTDYLQGDGYSTCHPVDSYRTLWNSINGAGAWEQNPWVVAISFTVEKRNIDQPELEL